MSLRRSPPSTAVFRRSLFVAGFLAAMAIRLTFLLSFPGDFDTDSYKLVAGILERGGNPYLETSRYNYSPAWGHVLVVVKIVADRTRVDFVLLVGLLVLAVDGATALVVYRLARDRWGPSKSALAALSFFLNPVSVLMSSYHCQFDNVAILFLLLALLLARSEEAHELPIAAALSASLLFKHVAWFHPLLFAVSRRRRPSAILSGVLPYLVFFASFLPYRHSWRAIWQHVFLHRGLTSYYGIEGLQLLPGVSRSPWLLTAVFTVASLAAVVLCRRVELGRGCLLLFLVMLIFLPGFEAQFCVWPLALGTLYSGPGYLLYTVVSGGFLVNIVLSARKLIPFLPRWYGPWWAAIAWLLWDLRDSSRALSRADQVA